MNIPTPLLLVAAAVCTAGRPFETEQSAPEVLRARRIEIIDEAGKKRIGIGNEPDLGAQSIVFYNAQGEAVWSASEYETIQPGSKPVPFKTFIITSSMGSPKSSYSLVCSPTGAALTLGQDAESGTNNIRFGFEQNTAFLEFLKPLTLFDPHFARFHFEMEGEQIIVRDTRGKQVSAIPIAGSK